MTDQPARPSSRRSTAVLIWSALGASWLLIVTLQTYLSFSVGLRNPSCETGYPSTTPLVLLGGVVAMAALSVATGWLATSQFAVPGWRAMPMVVVYVVCSLFVAPTVLILILAWPRDELTWSTIDQLINLSVIFVPGQSAFAVNVYLLRRSLLHSRRTRLIATATLAALPLLVWLALETISHAWACAS